MEDARMSDIQVITLNPGRLSDYGRWLVDCQVPRGLTAASFSDYLENKVLDHIFNDGTYSVPTASLGLWTSALTDASTGATAGEAAYTTYARVTIGAADMSAAASGSKTNTAAFTFPACTAGTSTVTFWGTFDSATIGAGNLLVWGTATSTVISTTQTPPTVAIGGLVVTLD
jgi:hypothetical protein